MTDNQPTASGVSEEMVNIIEAAHNKALSCPSDYGIRRILREGLEAALSAKPAQGGEGQLRNISRALRDDMVLNAELQDGRLSGSFNRQLWNDWAEAIGDLAPHSPSPQPNEALRESFQRYCAEREWVVADAITDIVVGWAAEEAKSAHSPDCPWCKAGNKPGQDDMHIVGGTATSPIFRKCLNPAKAHLPGDK